MIAAGCGKLWSYLNQLHISSAFLVVKRSACLLFLVSAVFEQRADTWSNDFKELCDSWTATVAIRMAGVVEE